MLVYPPSIVTEVVSALFAMEALVVALTTNDVDLSEQVVMELLQRSTLSRSHGIAWYLVHPCMKGMLQGQRRATEQAYAGCFCRGEFKCIARDH